MVSTATKSRPFIGLWTAVLVGSSILGMAPIARGSVTLYSVGRQISYTQRSNDAPTEPEFWVFQAVMTNDVADEVLGATVSFDVPPPVTYDLDKWNAYTLGYTSTYYTNEEEFLLNYPDTIYTFTADRGAGPETGEVTLPLDIYCEEIPALTGETYDRLQNCAPSLAFDGTINGFTLAPGTNRGWTNVHVVEEGANVTVFSVDLDPSETDFQIPAGLLKPATKYSIGIVYRNLVETEGAGFDGATSYQEYVRATTAYFTTLPRWSHRRR